MSYAQNEAGEKLVFKFGNGADPEVLTAACSINTDRKLDLTSDVFVGSVPRCDDTSAPNKTIRRIKGQDVKFTGAGIADMASFKVLLQLWHAGAAFNGKAIQDVDTNGWTITAPWVIENISVGGTKGEDQTFDISLGVADEFEIEYA